MHYLIFIAIVAFLSVIRRVKFVFVCALAFIVFSFSTREGSWDYYGYREYFLCAIDTACVSNGFEESFSFVSFVSNELFGDYAFDVVFLIYVSVSIFVKFKLFRKHSVWVGVSLFSYACYGFFVGEMTQLRASLAIAICWYSLSQYSSGRKLSAVGLIALATVFHASSALALIVPLLKPLKVRTLAVAVFLAAFFGYIIGGSGWIPFASVGFERVDVYLAAMGSELLTTKQLNFYSIVMLSTVLLAIRQKDSDISPFDLLCIKSVLFGVCFYLLLYFIPVIPLRVLEFYTSLYPFVVAVAFKVNKGILIRLFIVFMYLLLFANLAIKNNTRMDMVYDWQSIPYENMSEIQIEQFNRVNN